MLFFETKTSGIYFLGDADPCVFLARTSCSVSSSLTTLAGLLSPARNICTPLLAWLTAKPSLAAAPTIVSQQHSSCSRSLALAHPTCITAFLRCTIGGISPPGPCSVQHRWATWFTCSTGSSDLQHLASLVVASVAGAFHLQHWRLCATEKRYSYWTLCGLEQRGWWQLPEKSRRLIGGSVASLFGQTKLCCSRLHVT